MSAELQTHQISVNAELDERLPRVRGDQIQLQQVLVNLITNAIDSMVAVKDRERALRIFCNRHESGGIIISVEDSGMGIDSKDLDRIFDPLYTTKSKGMGMGLAICRSIIEAHKGTLRTMPNRAQGAVFQLVLPAEAS